MKPPERAFSARIIVSYKARDESDATQKATELSAILREAGYGHVSTTILDADGETVADFALPA